MLNVITLARWQFAVTTVYHFFFVPLTIGLAFLLAVMETLYVKKGDEKYKVMVKFWGKLFLINFAMGVVTGLVQEFQFGMNWSDYSRYVGDIFGVPLAIEALAAFFLESTFLGIWVFGWDKIPKKIHLLSIWIVWFSTTLSAFWILTANSFMHEPTGYIIRNGRAEMADFGAIITNPHLLVQFPHTIFASLATAAFFVAGVSAYHILRNKSSEIFRKSFGIAIVTALVATVLVIGAGDAQGKYLVKHLPMKMAAAEALWEDKDPAPLSLISVIDEKNKKNTFEIAIPRMLSFMSYNSFSGKVRGMNELQKEYEGKYGPGNYIPPVTISFYTFRIMVGAGMLMLLASVYGIIMWKRGKVYDQNWFMKFLTFMIAAPYLCNATGWILTEVSRQPWIVFGLLKTQNAVSPTVSSGYVLTSLLVYILLYTALIVVDASLMFKFAKTYPEKISGKASVKEESAWI